MAPGTQQPGPNAGRTPTGVYPDVSRQIVAALADAPGVGPLVEIAPRGKALADALRAAGVTYASVRADVASGVGLDAALTGLGETRALVLCGALGRLPDPETVLRRLLAYSRAHGDLPLLVVEPNAGYHAHALGLLVGESAAGTGGALAAEPTRPFTGPTLAAGLAQIGWRIAARHDLAPPRPAPPGAHADAASLATTETATSGATTADTPFADAALTDAASVPLVLSPTLIGDAARFAGATFNRDSAVSHFVCLLRPAPASQAAPANRPAVPEPNQIPRPLVSILMRTQGRRNEVMTEAFYSVLAQTCDSWELLLCFHDPDGSHADQRPGVERLIAGMPTPLRKRIRLIDCHEAGRGSPLNALLDAARGVYASFLDDDDLLFDNHVATIQNGVAEHGPFALFQTFGAQRLLEPVPMPPIRPAPPDPDLRGPRTVAPLDRDRRAPRGQEFPYSAIGMAVPWDRPLNPVLQHHENMIPICCLAIPLALVRQTTLRFRTDLEVGEDWSFWMEAMQILRVEVLPEVTAVVNLWNDPDRNAMQRPDVAPIWRAVRDARNERAAEAPLLLDGRARASLARAGHAIEQLAEAERTLRDHTKRLRSIQTSRVWQAARAIWWVRTQVQKAGKRASR